MAVQTKLVVLGICLFFAIFGFIFAAAWAHSEVQDCDTGHNECSNLTETMYKVSEGVFIALTVVSFIGMFFSFGFGCCE
jgi:high-affinity Fe2+/Pb2+ permease